MEAWSLNRCTSREVPSSVPNAAAITTCTLLIVWFSRAARSLGSCAGDARPTGRISVSVSASHLCVISLSAYVYEDVSIAVDACWPENQEGQWPKSQSMSESEGRRPCPSSNTVRQKGRILPYSAFESTQALSRVDGATPQPLAPAAVLAKVSASLSPRFTCLCHPQIPTTLPDDVEPNTWAPVAQSRYFSESSQLLSVSQGASWESFPCFPFLYPRHIFLSFRPLS